MASFGYQFSNNSPVLTMSPQASPSTPLGLSRIGCQHVSPNLFNPSLPQSHPAALTRPTVAGRKRSRDEAAANLEPTIPYLQPQSVDPLVANIPVSASLIAEGSSSTNGEPTHDNIVSSSVIPHETQFTSDMSTNCKAQRMDHSTDLHPSLQPSGSISSPFSSCVIRSDSTISSETSDVDRLTLQLGIGWKRLSDDEHIQAAARGWAKYIENHYPMHSVRICLESNSLQSYLVETSDGFYLFAENLRQGRLVGRSLQDTLANLTCTPPTFEGSETLLASESPRIFDVRNLSPAADTEMSMA